VALIASLMLKSMGVPNDDIAHWTAYIGAAWIFKPLWSPFLELASSKKLVVVSFQLLAAFSWAWSRWHCTCRSGWRPASRCWRW
jgi:PAT family beta-lactamase induction signal transducer AmpG